MSRSRKLLFVCNRNRWHIPTAEKIFHCGDGIQVHLAGTEIGARIKVTAGHMGWADIVFVMGKKHLRRLSENFGDSLAYKQAICLSLPHDF